MNVNAKIASLIVRAQNASDGGKFCLPLGADTVITLLVTVRKTFLS